MSLALTVLGCDGGYPGPGGAGSGYLVSADGAHLCLDLGPGTLARMQERIDPGQARGAGRAHLVHDELQLVLRGPYPVQPHPVMWPPGHLRALVPASVQELGHLLV